MMKQILRNIFLLLALLTATASAWAECYVLNEQPDAHRISIYKSKSYDNISGPCATLSFQARRGAGIEGLEIYEYVNEERKYLTKVKYADLTTSFKTYSYPLSRNASKIEFYNTGGIWKEVKEVKITQATYLDAPTLNGSALQDNSIPFGEDVYGAEDYKDIKLDWSNISALSCSFTKNDNSQFAAQVIDGNASTCAFGTATVRVTYKRTNVNTHTATLVISSGSLSHTINLSGKTGEFTVLAKKKIDLLMNSTYAPSDVFDVYYMKGGEKVIISDYTIIPLTSQLADYVDGKIQTNYRTGNASFVLSRIAKESCKALNETISVNVNPAGGCLVLEPCSGSCYVPTGGDFIPVDLIGPADYLSFQARKETGSAIGNIEIKQYVNNEWKFIDDANPGTDWRDYGYTLDESATKVGFFTSTGSYSRYFQNVQVTRKTYLRPSVSSLALPQATIGKPVSASFDLNWSTCSEDIVLVCDNTNFQLSHSSINASVGRGTTTITVTYDANSGSQSGTIIIYDQSQKIEISVSCEVKAKLTTEIIYTGNETYPNTPDGIPYPFYVKDENGNTVQGAEITLATSNEDILSFDETKIYPHCGGNVTLTATYEGDNTHEPCSLSVPISVPYCQREIVWNTSYLNFATDENGYIDDKRALNATINPQSEITYQLHTVTSTPFAEIIEENGTYSLHVFGEGHGYIVAIANECLYEEQMYETTYKIKEIRVSGAGACDPNSLLIWEGIENEPFVYQFSTNSSERTRIYDLKGLPAETMTFGAHAASSSYENRLVISFSTESEGDNWIGEYKQEVVSGSSYKWDYTCPVPAGAKRVRFQSEATLTIYFNGISIPQQTYIRPSVESIEISDAIVNVPFERTFSLDYSNVRLLQWTITNNHNLGLEVVANQEVNNDCGLYGSYSFTLKGESPYPQTNVTETITFYTSAGDEVIIPVTITATLSEPFYFNVTENGDWKTPTNWTYQGSTDHGMVPDKQFPIVISKTMTINEGELEAYGVTIEEGGSVNIQPTGGLTLHAGGFTRVDENNLVIHSNTAGSGFVRVSPFFTTKVSGSMPRAKVNFTTKANMNEGDNRNAAWQYIGAPGSGVGMDLAHTTVLYLRSEEKGWVRQYTEWAQLTPFAGYALTQKAQPEFTFYPQLINEDKTIQLTYTSDGMQGDNLWANSYMAPLDITKFSPGDFTGNVDYTFYLYNSGSWNAWNDNNNQNQSTTNDASISTPGRYYAINFAKIDATQDQTVIPPMQGVYMKAGEGGGTLTINYEKHVWNNTQTAQMNQPLRVAGKESEAYAQSLDFQRVRLQVNSENSGADRMYIIQDSMATAGYDNGYDAPKLMADGLMNIYTNEPFGKMEISSTDHMDGMYIGFQAGDDTHYIMTFTSLIGDSLYLYDLEEDKFVEMQDGEQYHFSAMAQSTNDMRFQVLVAPTLPDETPGQGGGVTTDVENITTPQLWISDRKVFVSNAKPNSTMAIYTASGMLITAPCTLHTIPYTLDLSYLPTGVYILRLNDQAYKFVCK